MKFDHPEAETQFSLNYPIVLKSNVYIFQFAKKVKNGVYYNQVFRHAQVEFSQSLIFLTLATSVKCMSVWFLVICVFLMRDLFNLIPNK